MPFKSAPLVLLIVTARFRAVPSHEGTMFRPTSVMPETGVTEADPLTTTSKTPAVSIMP